MEFKSNKLFVLGIGTIVGFIGLSMIVMYLVGRHDGIPFHLLLLGLLVLVIAVGIASFRSVVRLDPRTRRIEAWTQILGKRTVRRFSFKDFKGVRITRFSGSHQHYSSIKYSVELLGNDSVTLPGSSADPDEIRKRGTQIATLLELPLEDQT